jgi:transposase
MPMSLRFSTRRFFCDDVDCQQRIFAEQLPDLARPRARGTPRLENTLVHVGMECGGEPGRRLCARLGIDSSGDTILRRLRALAMGKRHPGHVMGIDDFAFRRGQRYGTIIVDHESGGVIDLLADRTSSSLESWLSAQPVTPTIVTRDRSGVYAKAIATAAPDAVQVADRWHLLANCRETLVRVLDRHHLAIAQAMEAWPSHTADSHQDAAQSLGHPAPTVDPPPGMSAESTPLSKNQQQSVDRRAKRVTRYERVLELRRQGHSQRTIVRQLKMSRRQVMKFLNAGGFPERAKTHRTGQVGRYIDHLRRRWSEGVRNAEELTRHIRTLGYTGSYDMVRRYVALWRTPTERLRLCGRKSQTRARVPLKLQRPSSDRLSWLMVKSGMEHRTGESELLDELQQRCEPIRVAGELARSFGEAIRGRDVTAISAWTKRAMQSTSTKAMNGFAHSLIRNWPEVKAAVELPWSNGRTEGHVNRLKLIKRKMYGRAKLDLLRIRVLGHEP